MSFMKRVSYLLRAVTSAGSVSPYPFAIVLCVCMYCADVWCGRCYQAHHCVYLELCWPARTLLLCLWVMGISESSVWRHVSTQMGIVIPVCVCILSVLAVVDMHLLSVAYTFIPTTLQPLGPRSDSQFWALLVFLHGNV